MRKSYDFSKAARNPYAKRLKKQITIRLDAVKLDSFQDLAENAVGEVAQGPHRDGTGSRPAGSASSFLRRRRLFEGRRSSERIRPVQPGQIRYSVLEANEMRRWFLLVVLSLAAGNVRADFDIEVMAPPGFADGLTRVAVVAVSCHESIDCSQVEDAAMAELVKLRPEFRVVAPHVLRKEVFARGATELTDELRSEIFEEMNVDGVLEVRIPFANRGDGFGGRRRSEVRIEVRLVTIDGKLRMTGRGNGRPKNVVSGTERVASNVVGKILKKAFR